MVREFHEVCSYLPPRLQNALLSVDSGIKDRVQEIRISLSGPLRLRSFGSNFYIGPHGEIVSRENGLCMFPEEMENLFFRLCDYSVYACQEDLKNGFVTLAGGHRAGLCGTAVIREDKVCSLRDITGVVLRISSDFSGGAAELLKTISDEKQSAVIFSAPGGGKTTVLRDLARNLALAGKNVSVIDERGEISGWGRYDLFGCDLLLGIPKAKGILQAVRTLSPQVAVCDEIGSEEEAIQVEKGFASGVKFLVSVHASSEKEAFLRPGMKDLLRFFDFAVFLKGPQDPGKIEKIISVDKLLAEPCCSGAAEWRLI